MKNSIARSFFLLVSFTFCFLLSCSGQLLGIKNQTYQSYNKNEERGYIVNFELDNTENTPKSVVINGIIQPILESDKKGNSYQINIIAQTNLIFGYKVKLEDKENGIYFEKNDQLIFKPVNFKLIQK